MRIPSNATVVAFLIAPTIALAISLDWAEIRARQLNSVLVRELGIFGYASYELLNSISEALWSSELLGEDLPQYQAFVRERAENTEILSVRARKRKNIVFIQYESIDGICAESTFQGEAVMPFFDQLSAKGLYFRNASDNTLHGRTSDGEFLVLTSLPPLRTAPIFTNHDLSKVPSLPRTLNSHGYHCISLHGFERRFWNRSEAHQALGYDQSLFLEDLNTSDLIGWGISDESLLAQASEIIKTLPEPFFLHIILLTNHHPYDHLRSRLGHGEQPIVKDYIDSVRYVDSCIEFFFETNRGSSRLNNAIFALFSDHDSGITQKVRQELTFPSDSIIPDAVPMLVLGTGHQPHRYVKAAGLQDIPVIVLDDLGISIPMTFVGNRVSSNAGNLHPSAGEQVITSDLLLSQSPPPIDLNKLTLLAINYPVELIK